MLLFDNLILFVGLAWSGGILVSLLEGKSSNPAAARILVILFGFVPTIFGFYDLLREIRKQPKANSVWQDEGEGRESASSHG